MDTFQTASSFDWDTLAPIIFLVLAGFAQLFSKMKKGNKSSEDEPEVDAEERARRIREEIRRKIQERKQAQELDSKPLGHPPRRVAYDPTLPEGQQLRPGEIPPMRNLQPEPARTVQPTPQRRTPVSRPTPGRTAAKQTSLEDRLREQMRLLEKAKKQQQEARVKARKMEKAALSRRKEEKSVYGEVSMGDSLRNQLVAGLQHPDSIRKAVLYREILDPPLGLR